MLLDVGLSLFVQVNLIPPKQFLAEHLQGKNSEKLFKTLQS